MHLQAAEFEPELVKRNVDVFVQIETLPEHVDRHLERYRALNPNRRFRSACAAVRSGPLAVLRRKLTSSTIRGVELNDTSHVRGGAGEVAELSMRVRGIEVDVWSPTSDFEGAFIESGGLPEFSTAKCFIAEHIPLIGSLKLHR